jgi:hypothetical protein
MAKSTRRTTQRGHSDGQVPTRPATTREIMSSPAFALGVADARAGLGPRTDYERWDEINDQWNYERGRQWAQQAPRTVALKRNGRVTSEAVSWYTYDII